MRHRSASACLLASVFLVAAAGAASPVDVPAAQPSKNKGRIEAYHVETGVAGASYDVDAKTYDAERPAGIHLFIGEGAKGKDDNWNPWQDTILKPQNLIGINLCYADGDFQRDAAGKVRAARIALAQVVADYHVVPGRGVVAAFGDGGLLVAYWLSLAKDPTTVLPFSQVALYSAQVRTAPADTSRLSWFIGLGVQEWKRQGPNNGALQNQVARDLAGQLLQQARKGGCADVLVLISAKGHQVAKEEVQAAAEQFARSVVALGPVVDPADFAAPALAKYVAGANSRALGSTLAALDKAVDDPRSAESDKARLLDLRGRIASRVAAQIDVVDELIEKDPVLAAYYARIGAAQLGKDDKAKEFSGRLAKLEKDETYLKQLKAHTAFVDSFASFVPPEPVLTPKSRDLLAQIALASPDGSLTSRMATALCVLPAK